MVISDIYGLNARSGKHLQILRLHAEDILVILVARCLSNGILKVYESHVVVLKDLGAVLEAVIHIAVDLVVKRLLRSPVILCQSAVTRKRYGNRTFLRSQ